jgi:hypothetical protein
MDNVRIVIVLLIYYGHKSKDLNSVVICFEMGLPSKRPYLVYFEVTREALSSHTDIHSWRCLIFS